MTYMYSVMFILLSGGQANALIFGGAVITASTPNGSHVDQRLQKVFAIMLVAVVCLFQGFSRINYIRFSDGFALYKVLLLSFVTVVGWCALANKRTAASKSSSDPYGVQNLSGSFRGGNFKAYAIAVALLDVMRVYGGYENANFVRLIAFVASDTGRLTIPRFWRRFSDHRKTKPGFIEGAQRLP